MVKMKDHPSRVSASYADNDGIKVALFTPALDEWKETCMNRVEITGNRNHDKSLGSLISGIFQDAQTLIGKEIAAAKLELKQEMSKGIKAGVSLGIGGFLLVVGFILLTLMIVFLISTYTPIPLWGSLGIVGLVYCVAGAIALIIGKRKVTEVKPVPEETLQHTKEDVRYIAERASSGLEKGEIRKATQH
ncbi:MAG TPA: phage holin family protein [Candidatus Binatia bacterium]